MHRTVFNFSRDMYTVWVGVTGLNFLGQYMDIFLLHLIPFELRCIEHTDERERVGVGEEPNQRWWS
jgi:hypothetical protein